MTKTRRMSLPRQARAATRGPAGTMRKMTVLIVTAITAPPTRVGAIRMEPLAGHIGPTAASADAGLFVRAMYFAELLYARKM